MTLTCCFFQETVQDRGTQVRVVIKNMSYYKRQIIKKWFSKFSKNDEKFRDNRKSTESNSNSSDDPDNPLNLKSSRKHLTSTKRRKPWGGKSIQILPEICSKTVFGSKFVETFRAFKQRELRDRSLLRLLFLPCFVLIEIIVLCYRHVLFFILLKSFLKSKIYHRKNFTMRSFDSWKGVLQIQNRIGLIWKITFFRFGHEILTWISQLYRQVCDWRLCRLFTSHLAPSHRCIECAWNGWW